jgi:4a-hydroxytetrahydrobiopterin dehydratase
MEASPATMEAITAAMAKGWREHGLELVRDFRFRDFDDALRFVEAIAPKAVDFGRHPDVRMSMGDVRFAVCNPNHAGLTEAELRLASKFDAALEEHHRRGHLPELVFEDGILRARQ